MHVIIGFIYSRAAFCPWLQERVALVGDTLLTGMERHDNRK